MVTIRREKDLCGCAAEIQPEGNECTVLCLPAAAGEALRRVYQVFPGIKLAYDDIHAQSCTFPRGSRKDVLEIRHCREGHMEGSMADEFYYMGPGDLSVSRWENSPHSFYDPFCHYHGITVMIDVEETPRCLSCFLDDVNVQPKLLMKKFCGGSAAFIARSQPSIEHIFSELYFVPEQNKKEYFKVKVLELLLFLTCVEISSNELAQRCYSHSQRLLARNVRQYLTEHMDSKITLQQLMDMFHISGTQIKKSVKNVYGTSLYSMIRMQKMESAAKMLRDTNMTILEIAGRHGYDNAGKFAGAFKTVMGTTPKEYRNAPAEMEKMSV